MKTLEEKVDEVLAKVTEKKKKDTWEIVQILSTITLGIGTVLLAMFNYTLSGKIADQNALQQKISLQAEREKNNFENEIKTKEEFLQELGTLPAILKMLGDDNSLGKNVARQLLADLQKNPKFANSALFTLSLAIKSERNASKSNNAVLIEAGKNKRQAFWVYLGQKQEGKWQSRYFDIDGLPALNSVIKSHANVFQHETKPVYRDDLYEWDLGKIKGTIKAGSTVTVVDTLTLIGNNYWAKVK